MNSLNITYIFKSNRIKALLYAFDILLISSVFLLSGFATSTFLNNRLTKSLDRSQKRIQIFFEVLSECLVTIIVVILLFYLLPNIPSIVYFPDPKHITERIFAQHFLLAFAILNCQTKLNDKIVYLLNEQLDKNEQIKEAIISNYEDCDDKGFTCRP